MTNQRLRMRGLVCSISLPRVKVAEFVETGIIYLTQQGARTAACKSASIPISFGMDVPRLLSHSIHPCLEIAVIFRKHGPGC